MRKTTWAAMALAGCVVAAPDARQVVGDAMTAAGDAMSDAGRAMGDSGASAQASSTIEAKCDRVTMRDGGVVYAYAELQADTDGATGADVLLCDRVVGTIGAFDRLQCTTTSADVGGGLVRVYCGSGSAASGTTVWADRWDTVRVTLRH